MKSWDILAHSRGYTYRWTLFELLDTYIILRSTDDIKVKFEIFLVTILTVGLCLQTVETLHKVYNELLCLIFMLLIWPFTSLFIRQSDTISAITESLRLNTDPIRTIETLILVVCLIVCLIDGSYNVTKFFQGRRTQCLIDTLIIFIFELSVPFIFESPLPSNVNITFCIRIFSQVVNHTVIVILTYDIFKVKTFRLAYIAVYSYIALNITDLRYMFGIIYLFCTPSAIRQLNKNPNVNSLMLKSFFRNLMGDFQRLKELFIIAFLYTMLTFVSFMLN